MNRLYIILMLMLSPFLVGAQGKGVEFIKYNTWEDVLKKARTSQKLIFIDCYATWCIPCKLMEKEVFSKENVGTLMNDKFVSIRLQMDSTAKDAKDVKKLYALANDLKSRYNIKSFPTFLILSKDGKLISSNVGYKADTNFLADIQKSLDKENQYYKWKEDFDVGKLNPNLMRKLALVAKSLKETALAKKVAEEYKATYLDSLTIDELCTKENLDFFNEFSSLANNSGTNSNFFRLIYEFGTKADDTFNFAGYSSFYVNNIITESEINSKIYNPERLLNESDVSWPEIEGSITRKFNKVDARALILDAQINYYGKSKEWHMQTKYFINKVNKYGWRSLGLTPDNTIASIMLAHIEDVVYLSRGLEWVSEIVSEQDLNSSSNSFGIYAAFLYKLNRIPESISWMERSLNIIKKEIEDNKSNEALLAMHKSTYAKKNALLNKMREGQKIDGSWVIQNFY